MICVVYKECEGSNISCFVKFYAEDFSLNNASLSSRLVEIDRNQVNPLLENNLHYMTLKRAKMHKISTSGSLMTTIMKPCLNST